MKKEYKKIIPTKNQINFFNSQKRDGESLYECALRLMGDSHRKLCSQKKKIVLLVLKTRMFSLFQEVILAASRVFAR